MSRIKHAFILAAGLGTRLRPLTDDLPKPLIPIFQKPLITFGFDHLIDFGIDDLIVNTHHLPERFAEAFPNALYRDRRIEFVYEPVLLETGGGIKNIQRNLGSEPFITYSGDVLTDFDLRPLVEQHFEQNNQVTLALRHTGLGAAITLKNGRVTSIGKTRAAEGDYDFANVAVWNPDIFDRLEPNKKIGFIPVVSEWLKEGGRVGGVVMQDGRWFNIGSRHDYLEVHRRIAADRWCPHYIKDKSWSRSIAPSAAVDATAHVRGCSVVGDKCTVAAEALLQDTIVWPGAQIASRSRLSACIVRTRRQVGGAHRNADI